MHSILLVEDHKVVRDGLKFYFEGNKEVRIASEASNGVMALELLSENKYDLVVTDLHMPEMDGIELIKQIRELYPDQPVLALTMASEAKFIKQLIQNGVNGYIIKDSGEDEIVNAVNSILSGKNYFSGEVTQTLIDDMTGKKVKSKQRLTVETPLSDREKEILKLIASEYSNPEIAEKLFISVRTVDAHKRNLLDKTGSKNVAGLIMYAVEKGLID